MKNFWIRNRELSSGIESIMDLYFRGRVFCNTDDITHIYDKAKYVVFNEFLKKYGSFDLNVLINVETDDNGKYWVKSIDIKR